MPKLNQFQQTYQTQQTPVVKNRSGIANANPSTAPQNVIPQQSPTGSTPQIGAIAPATNGLITQAPSTSLPTFPGGAQTPPKNPLGGGAPPPAAPGAPPEQGGWNDLEKFYQDIMGQHQASWADTEKGIMANQAMNQRRAAEINASMGRSIGGGMAGLMAQAQLSGQQQLMQGRAQHQDRGRQLQLSWLDKLVRREERLEDQQAASAGAPRVLGDGPLPTDPAERQGLMDDFHSLSDMDKTVEARKATSRAPKEVQDMLAHGPWQGDPYQRDAAFRVAYELYLRNGTWPSQQDVSSKMGEYGVSPSNSSTTGTSVDTSAGPAPEQEVRFGEYPWQAWHRKYNG